MTQKRRVHLATDQSSEARAAARDFDGFTVDYRSLWYAAYYWG